MIKATQPFLYNSFLKTLSIQHCFEQISVIELLESYQNLLFVISVASQITKLLVNGIRNNSKQYYAPTDLQFSKKILIFDEEIN